MSQTVGDFIVERLHAWGLRKIFGYPGDGINGVFGALRRAGGKIEVIQARHEETKRLTEALIKGDPHEGSVIVETAKQVLASLVPGK